MSMGQIETLQLELFTIMYVYEKEGTFRAQRIRLFLWRYKTILTLKMDLKKSIKCSNLPSEATKRESCFKSIFSAPWLDQIYEKLVI